MKICYRDGDPLPEHGWVVICEPLGQFAMARNLETLTWIVGMFEDEVFRSAPETTEEPVQVFEIDRDLSKELDVLMATLRKRS